MLVLLSLRVAGGVDALGRRKACCLNALSHWWMCCCYCAPHGKLAACCVQCMRQLWSLQVDFSLMHLAFGSYSIEPTKRRRVRQCMWCARGLARKTLS